MKVRQIEKNYLLHPFFYLNVFLKGDSVVIEDPFETNEHFGNFIDPSDLFRNRIERQEPNTNTKVAEGSKSETGEPGSSGAKESVSSKEITNEDIVRRRKLEKERFGEAQYVDYPEEESKKKKKKKAEETPEEKAKKEEKKNRKKARRTVEFLEGLAEIGLGVVLVIKVYNY